MVSPLIECRNKLDRAQEHFNLLNIEITEFLNDKANSYIQEYDREQHKYLFRAKLGRRVPVTRWALMIGDCVHNARSALDYIAWRLAGADLRDRNTQWPIFISPEGFRKRGAKRLFKMRPGARAEIARLQPYNRTNSQLDPFWILQELDARDKHKLLTTIYAFRHSAFLVINTPIGPTAEPFMPLMPSARGVFSTERRIENDTIIAEVLLPAGYSEDPQMEMEKHFTFDIAFERGIILDAGECAVRDTLQILIQAVDATITHFENLLTAHPDWIN